MLTSNSSKGSAVLVYFMVGVLFFVIGLSLATPLTKVVTSNGVMGVNGLNCSNVNITNYYKGVCMSVDVLSPIFIAIIFGLAGILISRILL